MRPSPNRSPAAGASITDHSNDATKLSREKYTLGEVKKLTGDVWQIPARIQYGQKDVTFPIGPQQSMTLKGSVYLVSFALPNFYFHATTAYDILRHAGVEIGKRDFLGRA